jgi:predicted choloylglycine hydrolase
MMFATPVRYRYATNLKLSSIGRTPVSSVFPNIEDIVMSSREFTDFNEAVTSANEFVAELTVSMNTATAADKYKMISEINPRFTGKETISKDWADLEVAKLWIIDAVRQASHPGPMLAVALTQLLEVPETPVAMN